MRRGGATEDLLLGPNVKYIPEGKGRIVKREQATRWSAKRGGLIPTEKGRPDYSGSWNGLAFEIEAKEVTSGTSFKFAGPHTRGAQTLMAQIKDLEENARAGALSFFVVHFAVFKKGIREAYLWEIGKYLRDLNCPFLAYAFGIPGAGKPISLQWFRDNALRIYEKNGGLDWGTGIQRVIEAKAALAAQNGGLLAAGRLD